LVPKFMKLLRPLMIRKGQRVKAKLKAQMRAKGSNKNR
jgi:hypothetical protein